jgi:tetratricopeptide (TPR) repeat protein
LEMPREEFAYQYLGEAYAALQRHAEAFPNFKKSMEVAPDSGEAKTSFVGYCLARFGELSAQMRSSQRGLAAEYRLQALSRKIGDPSRAELLERATGLADDAENWSLLALTEIASGEEQQGSAALEHAKRLAPDSLRVSEAEALWAAKKEHWRAVAGVLEKIAARSPGALARMLQEWPEKLQPKDKSELGGVASEFLKCVARSCDRTALVAGLPRLPKVRSEQGGVAVDFFKEERWELVVQLPVDPKNTGKAGVERGIAWAELGDCDKAVPDLERGLGAPGDTARAMFSLSRCYAQEADEVATQLAKSGKDLAVVHLMRGDVLLRLQADSKAAVAEYQAAVSARPDDPAGWERLAAAQLASEETDDARKSAQHALKLDAHRQLAMRTLSQLAMQDRNYGEALPFLRELAKQNPKDLTVRVQLGSAQSQSGELDAALINLDSALKENYPDEKGSLHYQLGTILRRLGKAAAADQEFAKAKELSDRFQNTSLRQTEKKD